MDDSGNLYDPNETAETAMRKKAVSRPKSDMLGRFQGCLLGGAVGDALGYPVEFLSERAIFLKYGPGGIRTLAQACKPNHPASISDDTQMTLFAANAWIYLKSHPELTDRVVFSDAAWL